MVKVSPDVYANKIRNDLSKASNFKSVRNEILGLIVKIKSNIAQVERQPIMQIEKYSDAASDALKKLDGDKNLLGQDYKNYVNLSLSNTYFNSQIRNSVRALLALFIEMAKHSVSSYREAEKVRKALVVKYKESILPFLDRLQEAMIGEQVNQIAATEPKKRPWYWPF